MANIKTRSPFLLTLLGFLASTFAATLIAVIGTGGSVQAAKMSNGWYEPVAPLPGLSAGFMTSSCNGNSDYVYNKYHLGNDYPKPAGTPVYAIGAGTVVARQEGWPGSAVFIKHTANDGTQFLAVYGHMSNAVNVGAKVPGGQQIGTVYSNHLHFGIRQATVPAPSGNGAMYCDFWPATNGYTDPIPYLNAHSAISGSYNETWLGSFGSNGAVSRQQNSIDVFGITSSGSMTQHYWQGAGWNINGGLGSPSGVTLTGKPSATIHDGNYHVFAIGNNGKLYQRVWNGSWDSWQDLGATQIVSGLTSVSPTENSIDVFGTTSSGTVAQHYWRGAGWNNSGGLGNPMGIKLFGAPSATIHNNNYHVLAVGSNGHLYQKTWSGSWNAWQDLGATSIVNGVATISRQQNSIDVFGITSSGNIVQHYWRGAGWNYSSAMANPSGVIFEGTPLVTIHNGDYHLYAVGNNGHLYQRVWNGSWGNWEDLGPTSIVSDKLPGAYGSNGAISPRAGAVDVFGATSSGNIDQHYWRGSGWITNTNVGSPAVATLIGTTATAVHNNEYHLFSLGDNGKLYQRVWDGTWTPWNDLGPTPIASGLSAISRQSGWVDVFGLDASGAVIQHYWRGSGWNSTSIGSPAATILTEAPTATVHEGNIHVFTLSDSGKLYQRVWNGAWGPWQDLGSTPMVSGLSAVSINAGAVDVFGITSSGVVTQHYWRGAGWSLNTSIGAPTGVVLTGSPAVATHNNEYHVFSVGDNSRLYQRVWNGTWGPWNDLGATSIIK